MLAWLLQRISGLLLLALVGLKIASGYAMTGRIDLGDPISQRHVSKIVDVPLLLLFLYHSFNGIRTMLIDLGVNVRYEKALFWALSSVGLLIFVMTLYLVYR